ncbi:putative inactive patatin-like protein 9 [Hibiscus syriacus]|uniref:Patatin n=1 Tax=Hibiscus syriacus TaxID=106335 RepID=A0A6A2Y1Y1_HIBSY|nr:probable inactive patatin-like protein 9 [Hibiscus syriacus]XP_039044990.1 probable inactive patatin-like protein 9 [Hibiscus syriacus]KAE8663687.1 putative inactive patatin-like protein 9 [Hibiscus syriacus]KAE8692082.1 putative inactive patatin-like protein 9 [Hibiscus syriacus]
MDLSKVTLEIFTKLEQKWLSHCETTKKVRILSIDGGGTTGIVAGAALIHLEDQIRLKTGDPRAQIADFFDMIAGTSVGAIIAAMLSADDGTGHPLFTAREAVRFITQNNSKLFKVNKLAGVLHRQKRFSCKSMDKVLKETFRREDETVLTLKDTCKPLLVPCFDLKSSSPFVFSRADASQSPSFNFELWKVCRATSATPSLFKPFPLTSVDGKTSCSAVDGGLVMNNPSAAAITHVLHNKRDFPSVNGVEDLLVLSLGNGPWCGRSKVVNNGKCSTSSVVDIVLDGVSETVDQMLGNAFCWNRADYVRIQANGLGSETMVGPRIEDLLNERGVESLPFGGKQLLTETNAQRIEGFVQRLVASGKTNLPPSPHKDSAVSPLANGR